MFHSNLNSLILITNLSSHLLYNNLYKIIDKCILYSIKQKYLQYSLMLENYIFMECFFLLLSTDLIIRY